MYRVTRPTSLETEGYHQILLQRFAQGVKYSSSYNIIYG